MARSYTSISPIRLPRLLGTLVMAFAPYEALPLLGAARLFSGMAIELTYRWANGQLVADPDNRAVLLYSQTTWRTGRRQVCRECLGVLCATFVGTVLVIINNTVLLLPAGVVLVALGMPTRRVADIILGVIAARLLIIGWRAVRSYRSELSMTAKLPSASGPRWRVDFLAAVPARSGHGGHLLDAFLIRADEHGAEVVLHCEPRNVAFYRHYGFRRLPTERIGGQHLMIRAARSRRRRPDGHRGEPSPRSGTSRPRSRR